MIGRRSVIVFALRHGRCRTIDAHELLGQIHRLEYRWPVTAELIRPSRASFNRTVVQHRVHCSSVYLLNVLHFFSIEKLGLCGAGLEVRRRDSNAG